MIKRGLKLEKKPKISFFLWGPRQTGKSSLLKATYPDSRYVDLLNANVYIKYLNKPHLLREEIVAKKGQIISPVVIDEIQKVPMLLDEVHWMIENLGIRFSLCGSSARKLKRGHANLLGGRAIRYELFGFSANELGTEFDLINMLNNGYLPRHYLTSGPKKLLHSYITDYLKEEIAEEGIVRNIPGFSNFLEIVSLSDTEIISFTNIARECAVSSFTVKEHFQILIDTLLGRFLNAYTKRPKRRIIQAPKFYFYDVGVVNTLARRGKIVPKSELFGKAFENWVFHELSAYNSYKDKFYDFSYWRLTTGVEVDFIINNMEYAIEAKSKEYITDNDLKGLRELVKDYKSVKKRIVVSLSDADRMTSDNILILGYKSFIEKLWNDELMA
ncbi:MAG: ATP-binding protein [Candidatus Melainabacteria bacterium]|nr:ATP-binding protein [Candidatus Melainabacteria bacterium]